MIAGAAVAPRVIEEFVVGLDLGAGQAFFPDELLQRGCGEQPTCKSEPADDGAPVGFLRQVALVDRRRVARPEGRSGRRDGHSRSNKGMPILT